MVNAAAQYRRALEKKLRCGSETKKQLLASFDQSLTAYLEETNTHAMEDLCAAFGPPEEMAKILMVEVAPQEQNRHRNRVLFTRILVSLLVLVLALSTIYIWVFKDVGLSSHNELEIIDQNINSTIDVEQGELNP